MDAYDGDDVAMVILASVAFLFPLHDCGLERRRVIEVEEVEEEEEVGMCGNSRKKGL